MELLILGLILVAIMAWASTRIKRNAAAAFDAETIQGDEFTVEKPDGWLSVAEPRAGHLFEAYSKEFGVDAGENIRRGTANITVSGGDTDEIVDRLLHDAAKLDDLREVVDGTHYRVLELERKDKDVTFRDFVKLGEKGGRVYTLSVAMLPDATGEFRRGVEALVDSFVLK